MKLEKQVCSIEQATKLHKLEVRTPSLFFYESTKSEKVEMWESGEPEYCLNNLNAYTVAELGELLPVKIEQETINTAFKFIVPTGKETDDEIYQIDEKNDKTLEAFKDCFNGDAVEDEDIMHDGGYGYDIIRYQNASSIGYFQDGDDEWNRYEVIEKDNFFANKTEADIRADLLIHLIENNLIEL